MWMDFGFSSSQRLAECVLCRKQYVSKTLHGEERVSVGAKVDSVCDLFNNYSVFYKFLPRMLLSECIRDFYPAWAMCQLSWHGGCSHFRMEQTSIVASEDQGKSSSENFEGKMSSLFKSDTGKHLVLSVLAGCFRKHGFWNSKCWVVTIRRKPWELRKIMPKG